MSHIKAHARTTASGKTVFVKEHLKKDSLPKHDAIPAGYEGPFHREDGEVGYKYSTTNHSNPEKRLNWSSKEHPEDRYAAELADHEKTKADLLAGRITPRRVVGGGYKPGAAKKAALEWLDGRISDAKKDLAEVKAKGVRRHDPNDRLAKPEPEKEKKSPQKRMSKEDGEHLFGKKKGVRKSIANVKQMLCKCIIGE